MSNRLAALLVALALAGTLAGCTPADPDKAACEEVAAYVRQETSRPRMLDRTNVQGLDADLADRLAALREAKDANPAVWELRLNTVAVRCLDLHDERGW